MREGEVDVGVRITALGLAYIDDPRAHRALAFGVRQALARTILIDHRVEGAALDGSAALRAVAAWLDELDPFASASELLTSGPTLTYADGEVDGALRTAGFVPASAGRGQLVVWSPPTAMVFYAPRELDGRAATNRVVTYLDLAASGIDRYLSAAEALWAER